MKRSAIVVATVGIVLSISLVAFANKYKRDTNAPQPSMNVISAEQTQSMSDCMTFCASHKGTSRARDRAMFQRQFGAPFAESGAVTEYNYDNLTKVALDCSGATSVCRCFQYYP